MKYTSSTTFVLFLFFALANPAIAKQFDIPLQMSPGANGARIFGIPLDADPNGKLLPILSFQWLDYFIPHRCHVL
jgi:hypothetical protein